MSTPRRARSMSQGVSPFARTPASQATTAMVGTRLNAKSVQVSNDLSEWGERMRQRDAHREQVKKLAEQRLQAKCAKTTALLAKEEEQFRHNRAKHVDAMEDRLGRSLERTVRRSFSVERTKLKQNEYEKELGERVEASLRNATVRKELNVLKRAGSFAKGTQFLHETPRSGSTTVSDKDGAVAAVVPVPTEDVGASAPALLRKASKKQSYRQLMGATECSEREEKERHRAECKARAEAAALAKEKRVDEKLQTDEQRMKLALTRRDSQRDMRLNQKQFKEMQAQERVKAAESLREMRAEVIRQHAEETLMIGELASAQNKMMCRRDSEASVSASRAGSTANLKELARKNSSRGTPSPSPANQQDQHL